MFTIRSRPAKWIALSAAMLPSLCAAALRAEDAPGGGAARTKITKETIEGMVEFRRRLDEAANWKQCFEDSFEREEPGKDWRAMNGKLSIVDGSLLVEGDANASCYVICARPLSGVALRIDYEAMSDDSPQPCDLSCFACASVSEDPKPAVKGGYGFQFGGHNNTENWATKANKVLWTDKGKPAANCPRIQPKVWHKVSFRIVPGLVKGFVDNKEVFAAADAEPAVGDGSAWGLYVWNSRARFRNVRAYQVDETDKEGAERKRKALWASLVGNVSEDEIQAGIPGLVEQLGDDDYFVRRSSFDLLEKLGASARDALTKALEHKDTEIRISAEELLKKMGVSQPKPPEPPRRSGN